MTKTIRRNAFNEWSIEGRVHVEDQACMYKKKALIKTNSSSSGRQAKQEARTVYLNHGKWYNFV